VPGVLTESSRDLRHALGRLSTGLGTCLTPLGQMRLFPADPPLVALRGVFVAGFIAGNAFGICRSTQQVKLAQVASMRFPAGPTNGLGLVGGRDAPAVTSLFPPALHGFARPASMVRFPEAAKCVSRGIIAVASLLNGFSTFSALAPAVVAVLLPSGTGGCHRGHWSQVAGGQSHPPGPSRTPGRGCAIGGRGGLPGLLVQGQRMISAIQVSLHRVQVADSYMTQLFPAQAESGAGDQVARGMRHRRSVCLPRPPGASLEVCGKGRPGYRKPPEGGDHVV